MKFTKSNKTERLSDKCQNVGEGCQKNAKREVKTELRRKN